MLIRYLHLSDLHLTTNGGGQVQKLNQDIVTASMLRKIEDLVEKGRSFDFVVITGDIAATGKRAEYEVAEMFCEELRRITEVETNRLYVVPGNHDVDRKCVKPFHVDTFYKFDSQDRINEILNDETVSALIKKKFNDFNDFAERVMKRRLFDEQRYHFVELVDLTREGMSLRFNIMGLNSALFCGYDGDEKQNLAFGLTQVNHALNQLTSDALFSLAIFHHPFSCFHPADVDCQVQLVRGVDLILHGHLHDHANAAILSQTGEVAIIGAGASFETRESENSFNIVQINVSTGAVEVEVYKYLGRKNTWVKDHDINDLADDGLFRFDLPKLAKTPGLPDSAPKAARPDVRFREAHPVHITFIHDYLLPKSFTGRMEELERLKLIMSGKTDPASNNRASITAVTAIGGVGKSCLARQAVEESLQALPYKHIIWFSLDEARTEDVGYFFRKVLEKLDIAPESLAELKSKDLCDKLSERMDAIEVLLVLDGFEAIQNTLNEDSPSYGNIQEPHKEINLLLRHLCNQDKSRVVITSRVSLKELNGMVGYVEIPLETFSSATGASLLSALGVEGESLHLESCSRMFGGHALCLVAAGKYMAWNQIRADEVERLIGDARFFRKNSEGERVAKIVAAYRQDLTPEQEYFLMMLSIHPRPVSRNNFSVLVKGYREPQLWLDRQREQDDLPGLSYEWDLGRDLRPNFEPKYEVIRPQEETIDSDEPNRDEDWVRLNIIEPLRDRGLIDLRRDSSGQLNYSAHPLMKVAYTTWMEKDQRINAHELWAEAAKRSPQWVQARFADSIEQLQIALDVIDHYLDSGNYSAAWDIYYRQSIVETLDRLNYGKRQLEVTQRINAALENGKASISSTERFHLYDYLARAYNKQGGNDAEVLKYRQKLYETAQELEAGHYVTQTRNILAACYLDMGNLAKAATLTPLGEREQGLFDLCSGNYEAAISRFRPDFAAAHGHSKTVTGTCFGEALTRAGNLPEAERVLNESIEYAQARSPNFQCCIKDHLSKLTMLQLKAGDVREARRLNDKRLELYKATDLSVPDDDSFLLVAEGQYDQAIKQAQEDISLPDEPKLNQDSEITALLVLAQAWHGKQEPARAKDYLARAHALIQTTGCWKERDRFQYTEAMIGR